MTVKSFTCRYIHCRPSELHLVNFGVLIFSGKVEKKEVHHCSDYNSDWSISCCHHLLGHQITNGPFPGIVHFFCNHHSDSWWSILSMYINLCKLFSPNFSCLTLWFCWYRCSVCVLIMVHICQDQVYHSVYVITCVFFLNLNSDCMY